MQKQTEQTPTNNEHNSQRRHRRQRTQYANGKRTKKTVDNAQTTTDHETTRNATEEYEHNDGNRNTIFDFNDEWELEQQSQEQQ